MADQQSSRIIARNPIGKGLDAFRASFKSVCEHRRIVCPANALDQLDVEALQDLTLELLGSLNALRASRLLRSCSSGKIIYEEVSRLGSSVISYDFDLDIIKGLLKAALAENVNDALIWGQVRIAIAGSIQPSRQMSSSTPETSESIFQSTISILRSSEYRTEVDEVLKRDVGPFSMGLPLYRHFFERVTDLKPASEAIFARCIAGDNPLFKECTGGDSSPLKGGWSGWPGGANQYDALSWLATLAERLAGFAEDYKPTRTYRRKLFEQPNTPVRGVRKKACKLDIGFESCPDAGGDTLCRLSHVLVPGQLKRSPGLDKHPSTSLDIAMYAREVFAAQETRRFVLAFTLCGSLMRVWEFDRLGGIASEEFDINKDGLRFVFVILGFLWMNEKELGFDPTITKDGENSFITINREGRTERLVITKVVKRAHCIAGRATTCWKAYGEEDPQRPLVIKDSWQYLEREEEGELLKKASDKNVPNVARYYHHETVIVGEKADEIQGNVRGGLLVTDAVNHPPERPALSPGTNAVDAPLEGQSSSNARVKRSLSNTDNALPPSKRSRLTSSSEASKNKLPNRVHRRVIVRDYGRPIYEAASRSALLAALEGCINGHEALHREGFLHRDISINNLMINEERSNPDSWPSFLIDLDLAIEVGREKASEAQQRTGTRAFMAIEVLLGTQHSFMHDLESFFWVLFWICIHYDGPGLEISKKGTAFLGSDKWSFRPALELATLKTGMVSSAHGFSFATAHFTRYYKPLAPWVEKLRQLIFPGGERQGAEDEGLYCQMKRILRAAREAMGVLEAGSSTQA